jgi:2-amino-4-hydroxy-6-hydroxymethyldihydropteridine diphosphokinase
LVTSCAIALGSNLGDRRAHLDYAVSRLRAILQHPVVSAYLDTVPVDMAGSQQNVLNAAMIGETTLSASDLLDTLLAIEAERGRERPHRGAARTLDLDLVLYGDAVIDEAPRLIVPHPRFRERRFVLEPLAQIGPELKDPVTGRTVRELLERLGGHQR